VMKPCGVGGIGVKRNWESVLQTRERQCIARLCCWLRTSLSGVQCVCLCVCVFVGVCVCVFVCVCVRERERERERER